MHRAACRTLADADEDTQPVQGPPTHHAPTCVLHPNPFMSAEPMMESWPVSIEYQHTGLSQRLSLHSLERLNLVVTPAAFRSIGDARLFYSMMMSLSTPPPAGMVPKALDATSEAPAPAKNMLSTMYRQDSQSKYVLMDVLVGFGSSTRPVWFLRPMSV